MGPHTVDSYSRKGYNWQTAQAGGASIFPGATTCSGNFATDPKCLSATQIPVSGVNSLGFAQKCLKNEESVQSCVQQSVDSR